MIKSTDEFTEEEMALKINNILSYALYDQGLDNAHAAWTFHNCIIFLIDEYINSVEDRKKVFELIIDSFNNYMDKMKEP